jgi:hypothetical protein
MLAIKHLPALGGCLLLLTRGRVAKKDLQNVNLNPLKQRKSPISAIVDDYSKHDRSHEYNPQHQIRNNFGLKRD